MASDNEEALYCHVTGAEPNHWTVTVCRDSLLAWNSIMAQIDNDVGGSPLGQIWHVWVSATGEDWGLCRAQTVVCLPEG